MLEQFGYIGLFLVIALIFPAGGVLTAWLLAPRKSDPNKEALYECGMETIGDAWVQFHVRYYFYALIFLIFDIEAVFLFPWAAQFRQLALFGFIEMFLFIAVLLVGYVYAWRKRALEWR
ncbi:MAG: NADH:ubiquinone oxidoreductase subunit A [Chloroflexota bacterium]